MVCLCVIFSLLCVCMPSWAWYGVIVMCMYVCMCVWCAHVFMCVQVCVPCVYICGVVCLCVYVMCRHAHAREDEADDSNIWALLVCYGDYSGEFKRTRVRRGGKCRTGDRWILSFSCSLFHMFLPSCCEPCGWMAPFSFFHLLPFPSPSLSSLFLPHFQPQQKWTVAIPKALYAIFEENNARRETSREEEDQEREFKIKWSWRVRKRKRNKQCWKEGIKNKRKMQMKKDFFCLMIVLTVM